MEQGTLILAIRHGETAWNREGRLQGHLDIPLNAVGQQQACRVGEALADQPLQAVYASDLQRACATAEAIAGHHGLLVQRDGRLRERGFGRFEGLRWPEIEAAWPDEAARWRRREPDFEMAGGESLARFFARCVPAVTELAQAHAGGSIAVVVHGGVLDCLYRAATHLDLQAPRSWVLGNAAINRLLYSPQGLSLVGWNDDQHLQGMSLDELGT